MEIKCPVCGSTSIQSRGPKGNGKWQYYCTRETPLHAFHSRYFVVLVEDVESFSKEEYYAPNVWVFDIETSLAEFQLFSTGKQYVNYRNMTKDWNMISFSAKRLYSDEIYGFVQTPKEAKRGDDSSLMEPLWNMLNDCDWLIGYNSNHFDIPKSNTRLLVNGYNPYSPFRSIDVYETIKARFGFMSNSLAFVNYKLGLDLKKENEGLGLWQKCSAGDATALNDMLIYNKQDVVALESMYLKIRGWIKNHPNWGVFGKEDSKQCRYCGSTEIKDISQEFSTDTGKYKSFVCSSCNGVGRYKTNELSKLKIKNILR